MTSSVTAKFGNGLLTSNCCGSSCKKINSGFQFHFRIQDFQFQFHFQFHQFQFQFQLHRPKLVVHADYHYERCSRCGQLDVKYSGKVDISVDKIFLFKLFFLGFFSVCLPNIYFNMSEYLSILDLLSFAKSDL